MPLTHFKFKNHLLLALLSASCLTAHAEVKEYVRDYTYVATNYDSKITSRINAIDGLKTSVLDEIGVYVGQVIEINKDSLGNAYMSADTVQITAGIISLNLLKEDWNRIAYYVQGKLTADDKEVLEAVKALRRNQELEEALRYSLNELNTARDEIAQLKKQIEQLTAPGQQTAKGHQAQIALLTQQYVDTVKDMNVEDQFQQAMQAYIKGNFDEAFNIINKLAADGYLKAQTRLGYIYENGLGIKRDYSKALEWYQKADAAGFTRARVRIGFLYERGLGVDADPVKAINIYEEAIAQGDGFAMARLGQMYIQGDVLTRNYQKAYTLFENGVASNSNHALPWLGEMYEKGYYVAQDTRVAAGYFQKASDKGDPWAMAKLGNLYLIGNGVTRDTRKAYALILAGANRGNGYAIGKLGHLYEIGLEVPKDKAKAFELYQESAHLGAGFGFFKLGVAYDKGIGVAKDKTEARKWYEKAAARGIEEASKNLDRL